VGANQPLLQVAYSSVSQGHDGFGALPQLGPDGLNAADMLETDPFQALKAFQPIGVNGRSRRYVLHEEAVDGVGREVGDDPHAEAPRSLCPLLDCHKHECRPTPLELAASSDTAWVPPTHVSSISTSPRSGSRVRLTIARRSLWSIIQAIS